MKVANLPASHRGIVSGLMEHAPLRPVPARPAGPIAPPTALREVESWLPTLPPAPARALALVVLAEQPRATVAEALEVSERELGELLAEARKELRQILVVLGGSGWCERAERLISDRLDGGLADRDVRRLDVHLRNCPRCVEHERRLVQATDALVAGAGGFARSPAPAGQEPPSLVEVTPPTPEVPPEPAPATPTGKEIAAAAEVLVAARSRRQIAAAVVWNAMIAIAVLLTIATIALAIAGLLGAKL
jgi:hypothetical protein